MIGLIVTGHGHFATGMEAGLHVIGGVPEHFRAVDFELSDSEMEEIRRLDRHERYENW